MNFKYMKTVFGRQKSLAFNVIDFEATKDLIWFIQHVNTK